MLKIEYLYTRYKEDVYSYLLSLTHNPSLAEDLLQETFLRAIRSLTTFQYNSTVKTWLFGIARNIWLQNLRAAKPQATFEDFLEVYISQGIENAIITKQAVDRVYELLSEKDHRTREIILMRIDGYSYSEISEKVGIAENSARVVDYRIKKWLRTKLETEGLV